MSFDFSLLTEREDDVIGEAVEDGMKLFAGVVPGTDGPLSDPGGSVMGVRKLWRRLGLAPGTLAESVVVTLVRSGGRFARLRAGGSGALRQGGEVARRQP